jgi:hypothetical protein
MEAVERRARERPTTFFLLIPNVQSKSHAVWTLAGAVELLERAAHGHVESLIGDSDDPFDSVKRALDEGYYDDVLISTLSKRTSEWLRRDLPRRVGKLGVPVEVISQPADKGPLPGVVAAGGGGM